MNIFELYASLKLDDSEYEQGLNDAEKKAYHIGEGIGTALNTAGKVGGAAIKGVGTVVKGVGMAVGATAAAITPLVKSAVSAYGEQQQLVGGMETLYKSSSDTMIKYANEAYKTAGMSANEYMNTAIESSAAMINSLGGDTEKAAEKTNMAIIDMADNVNKMGTSMESIQNAYRGFSRGNFTMLDNLALGFSGTKEGMQQLLDKAQELSGVEYDIGSYSDIVDAIHVVQTEMGITGTTSKEAGDTITGSLSSVKSAWENLVAGIGGGQDLAPLIDNLVKSAEGALKNLIPTIQQSLIGVADLISSIAPIISEKIPELVNEILPPLIDAAVSILNGLVEALPSIIGALQAALPTLIEGINTLILGIVQALPQLLQLIIDSIITLTPLLVEGIIQALPALISGITQLVVGIINHLPEIVSMIIEYLPQIIMTVATALIENFPLILDALLELGTMIFEKITTFGAELLPKIDEAMTNVIESVKTWLSQLPENVAYFLGEMLAQFALLLPRLTLFLNDFIPKVKEWGINLINTARETAINFANNLIDGLKDLPNRMLNIGHNIVEGLKTGISNAWSNLVSWASGLIDSFVEGFKGALKIGSPSKVFADEVGKWIPEGIASGIEANSSSLYDTVDDLTNNIVPIKNPIATSIDNMTSTFSGISNSQDANVNVNVYLEGDAQGIFRVVRTENDVFTKANGVSAFA